MTSKPVPRLKVLKQKQLLYQAVQEEVKSYIIQHGLKPGDPLPPETELAQQLSISRNSVREAIKALEALGILEARPGTGLFVRDFSFDPILNNLAYGMLFDLKKLTDVLEVRFHLEYGMVERVIREVTPEQVAKLRDVLDMLREAAEYGRYSAEADRAFHQHLYDNVNNLILWKILDIFWEVMRQAQEHIPALEPHVPLHVYRVHVPIVDALDRRDVQGMRDALTLHYEGIRGRLQRAAEAQNKKA